MNKQEQIDKMVEEALNSADNVQRAGASPWLYTRIRARMNKQDESVWEKAGRFIARPAVAFTGICLVVLINAAVVFYNKSTPGNNNDVVVQNSTDEFSYTVSGIYEIENTQQ